MQRNDVFEEKDLCEMGYIRRGFFGDCEIWHNDVENIRILWQRESGKVVLVY